MGNSSRDYFHHTWRKNLGYAPDYHFKFTFQYAGDLLVGVMVRGELASRFQGYPAKAGFVAMDILSDDSRDQLFFGDIIDMWHSSLLTVNG